MNKSTEFWTRLQLFIKKDHVNVGTLHYTFGSVKFSSSFDNQAGDIHSFTSQNPSPIDSDIWGINELQKQESQNAVNVGTSKGILRKYTSRREECHLLLSGLPETLQPHLGETDTTFMIEQSWFKSNIR